MAFRRSRDHRILAGVCGGIADRAAGGLRIRQVHFAVLRAVTSYQS